MIKPPCYLKLLLGSFGQFFSWHGKDFYHIFNGLFSLPDYLLTIYASNRVGDNNGSYVRHAQRLSLSLPKDHKLIRANGRCRRSSFLKFNRVVDTPRRACPSIADTDDHKITLC
jgi:hypothetical protein